MSKFVKAEKKKAKLRLGISGPSGSGKTYSALRLAKGLGGKIAVIDTEKGSASLYATSFDFDVLELTPPYTTEKYIEAIGEASQAGYEVVIVDSISHAWAGEGGILQQKEQVDSRGGNSFTNWAKFTPKQERFIASIVGAPLHVICTMRSKQDYIMESNSQGKQAPKKIGLAPVQREGFEYELTTMFDVAINHDAQTSKDRTGLFVDKIFQITEKTGIELKEWLNSGIENKEVKNVDISNNRIFSFASNDSKPDGLGSGASHNNSNIDPGISDQNESIADYLPQKPGDYKFTFGINDGKLIKDIPIQSLKGWLEWTAQQKNLKSPMKEAVENVKLFLTQVD